MLIGWVRGQFFLIFFLTKAKLLSSDWPSAKITRIWLAERESAPFAFCRGLETQNGFWVDPYKVSLLTEMDGKNDMEIGCLLEEKFQKVNLYVLRETANCYFL